MSEEKSPYPSRTADQFVVRFPDGMRDALKEEAHANGRSMNAEIVARLQQSFDAPPGDEALKAKLEAAEKTIESHESYEFAIRWVSIIKDSLLAALLKTAEDADVQAPAVDLARQFLDAQEEKNLDGLGKVMDKILGISSARRRKGGASASASADGLSKKDLETIILAKSQEVSRLLRVTTKPLEEEG